MPKIITNSFKETRELGKKLAVKLSQGGVVCLQGDLGSGKTTFAQGLLKGLNIRGPYTSPTFLIIKQYKIETESVKLRAKKNKRKAQNKKLQATSYKLQAVYHIDAYRVKTQDILNLGWEEMLKQKGSIIIVEWADRIRKIIPANALWIKFKWVNENKRKIFFSNYF